MSVIIQEAMMPKLSQTSLYKKFDDTSQISKIVIEELQNSNTYRVVPSDITEILAIIKLNGDSIARKAIEAYEKGKIVIINNKQTSKVPMVMPYITIAKGNVTSYIFANNIVNEIKSTREYTSLMAALEAAYLSLRLQEDPDLFISNSQLVLSMCNIYTYMAVAPIEQRLYMKGDNLTKAMLYFIGYFYRIIKDDLYNPTTIPFKRFLSDRVDPYVAEEIFEEIGQMESMEFSNVLRLISNINPVRYKTLPDVYLSHFVSTCGTPVIFALENPAYLFMLITSAEYKTQLTQYSLNKLVNPIAKRIINVLAAMNV